MKDLGLWLKSYFKFWISNSERDIKSDKRNKKEYLKKLSETPITENNLNNIEYWKKQIKFYDDRISTNKIYLKKLKETSKETIKLRSELSKKILNHDKITSFIIDEDALKISTSNIKCSGKNVGRFEIQIHKNYERIFNSSFTSHSYNHPHVNSGGDPCYGDNSQGIYTYRKNGQIFLLIDSIIRFLENYSDGNPYIHMNQFIEDKIKIS